MKDIYNAYQTCQKIKVQRQTKSLIPLINLPTIRFNTVHLDLIGPLPVTRRHHEIYNALYTKVLTNIEGTTK